MNATVETWHTNGEAGQRMLPGIGDVVIEAWGPTRAHCMEAAARTLADPDTRPAAGRAHEVVRRVGPGEDRHVLAAVLQAVLDVRRSTGLPVCDVGVAPAPDGGVRVRVRVGAERRAPGVLPRRVQPQWVSLARTSAGGWRCEAILDR